MLTNKDTLSFVYVIYIEVRVTTVPSLRVGGGVDLHVKGTGTGADKGPDSQVVQQLVPLLWTQVVVRGRDEVIRIPLSNPKTCNIIVTLN